MEGRIESVVKVGKVYEEIQVKHKGFFEWNSVLNSRNHQTILQVNLNCIFLTFKKKGFMGPPMDGE